MKTVTLLKAITFVLSLAIAAGLTLVAVRIADFQPKSKTPLLQMNEVQIPFPESITDVMACGSRLCLMTVGHEKGRRLFIINPERGATESIITFNDGIDDKIK